MHAALRTAVLLVSLSIVYSPAARAQANPDWHRAIPGFRIAGSLYYVGTADLAVYLVTTPQGNILINTGVGDTAQQIGKSVEQLGFKLSDTRILTATHGHYDHVAGLAELKRVTGARLIVSEPDRPLLESGGKADFGFGSSPGAQFEPVKVDELVASLVRIGREQFASLEDHASRAAMQASASWEMLG